MTCLDCGGRSRGPLCVRCARVAEALGLSVDERLTQLGEPTLLDQLHALGVEVQAFRARKGSLL